MQTEAIEQFHFVSPMMASSTDGKVAGAALAAGTGNVIVDLTTLPAVPSDWPVTSKNIAPNVIGHFMDMTAEGGDVYFIFGPTLASVSGANAPNPATNNTVTSNAITSSVGVCMYLPAGQTRSFKLWAGSQQPQKEWGTASPCRFMAFITKAGTATLRINMSSELR